MLRTCSRPIFVVQVWYEARHTRRKHSTAIIRKVLCLNALASSSGGRSRTYDTRIMIPLL